MAEVFTDTPKIGVAIGKSVDKADLPRSGHRPGSKVWASDGKAYEFKLDENGNGVWAEAQ